MGISQRIARRILPAPIQVILRTLISRGRTMRQVRELSFPDATSPSAESPFPCVVGQDNQLEALGAKYLPSKRLQNYLSYYWMHFRDIRLDVNSVLEIGVETGRSLCMWEEFFPNAAIYGIDIDPQCKQCEGGRRTVFVGDQGDRDFLRRVTQQARAAFDIVIDDGSHRIEDQLTSLECLLPRMSDHGIYVIEDTGLGDGLRTVEAVKRMVDGVMHWPDGLDPREWLHLSSLPDEAGWAAKHVIGVAFYRWIIFVMRGRNPEDNPHLTPVSSLHA